MQRSRGSMVQAELHVWPGGWHAFDLYAPGPVLSNVCLDTRMARMKRVLLEPPPVSKHLRSMLWEGHKICSFVQLGLLMRRGFSAVVAAKWTISPFNRQRELFFKWVIIPIKCPRHFEWSKQWEKAKQGLWRTPCATN